MSTKTLRKRIALVAVSALGFGLISVVPASAAFTSTAVTAGTTTPTVTTTVGVAATANLTFSTTGTPTLTDDAITFTPTVTSRPAGATVTIANAAAATSTSNNLNLTKGTDTGNWAFTYSTTKIIATSTTAAAAASGVALGSLTFVPASPGRYVVTVTPSHATATPTFTAVSITIIALPAQASGTTSLSASVSPSVSVAATDTVITVARNAGGVEADGPILGIVTSTSDDTDLPVGTVIGRVSSSTTDLEDNVATDIPSSTANRTFTFDNNLSTKALAVASTTLSGTYGFTFWVDTNSNGAFDSGEVSTTASYTIVAALSADTGISVSIDNATRANSSGVNEFTVTATIADGSAATITESGTANLTNIIAGTSLARVGTSTQYRGTYAVDATPAAGSDYVDVTLTVTSGSYSNTATLRVVTLGNLTTVAGVPAAAITDAVGIGTVTAGVKQTLTGTTTTNISATVDRAVTTQAYTFTGATGEEGEYLKVAVAPAGTTPVSVVAPAFALVPIGADLRARYSVVSTAPAAANSYTMTVTGGDAADVLSTITYATATPAWSLSPTANIRAKFGDTMTVTGTLADQFGRALSAKAVYVSVTGRQAGTYNGTTAADGTFAFKWTDTNAATTVTLTDALTFNYPYFATATSTTTTLATSGSRTVTYSATGIAVGSVSVAAPSATNTRPIDVDAPIGLPGAGSRVTYTATVLDAAGLPVVAGALVTFAGGADDLFYGGTTGVTDEFGQASVVVYRNKVGAPAITATAGGVTSAVSAAVQWTNDVANATADSAPIASSAYRQARYIALKADNATAVSQGVLRFTASVTDRFGNAVAGVQVTFAETGAGRFFNPPTSNQVTTNAAGEASIDLNSQAGETGTASVTAVITSANSVQAINEDAAGFVTHLVHSGTATDAAGTFTGTLTAVAGVTAAVKSATATATITKDTSTSTADALLALATALGTRDQASATVDAAAEATDAANAATDAANAAAEAADAATAAAQDASDAVAALSAQVSEAIAGLRKQLVSLTNLVIKIQKKVRA